MRRRLFDERDLLADVVERVPEADKVLLFEAVQCRDIVWPERVHTSYRTSIGIESTAGTEDRTDSSRPDAAVTRRRTCEGVPFATTDDVDFERERLPVESSYLPVRTSTHRCRSR